VSSILDLSHQFELGDRAYLDGAAHGPMPRRSLAAARSALDLKRDPSALEDAEYFRLPDRIRAASAGLLHCAPESIAVATGASHGISLVACGLDWEPGDHVVVPTGSFPAIALPWRDLARRGVDVDFVQPDAVVDTIRADTRVVAVGHVNFATGRRLDLTAIGARCGEVGALFLVDASQSLGVVPVDVIRCGAAVVAVAGYKWLLSPYGTGVTYVQPDWVERLRLATFNWTTIVGADDFNKLADLEPRQRPGAIRFDAPETAAFIHGCALAESLEFLGEIGVEAINHHVTALLDRLFDGLPKTTAVESSLVAAHRSSIARLVPEGNVRAMYAALYSAGIKVSLREGGLRVAPGVWNTVEDIDRLLAVLREEPARTAR